MAEGKITVDDVVELLAKHAGTPSDPDDAATLAQFNQQVADDKAKAAESPPTTEEGL